MMVIAMITEGGRGGGGREYECVWFSFNALSHLLCDLVLVLGEGEEGGEDGEETALE